MEKTDRMCVGTRYKCPDYAVGIENENLGGVVRIANDADRDDGVIANDSIGDVGGIANESIGDVGEIANENGGTEMNPCQGHNSSYWDNGSRILRYGVP